MPEMVLLLNSTCEILHFITFKKAIRLIVKNKVDILSTWDKIINWPSGYMNLPATLKLKYFVKKKYTQLAFSRKAVFKRDNYHCQYCNKPLKLGQATVDHIFPKSMGGTSSFKNCVTSCYPCNNKKGNRTLEQTDMLILVEPIQPIGYIHYMSDKDGWHDDWNLYIHQ